MWLSLDADGTGSLSPLYPSMLCDHPSLCLSFPICKAGVIAESALQDSGQDHPRKDQSRPETHT